MRGEELHVHGADVGDDADRRLGQGNEPADVAGPLHTHLEHQAGVLPLEAEHGQRDAGLGVEIARCTQHFVLTREDGRDHLFSGGFAVAAGDRDDQWLYPVTHETCQRVKRCPRVRDEHLNDARYPAHAAFDDQGGCPAIDGVFHERVPVHLRALEGKEHPAGDDLARVRMEGAEGIADHGAADLAAPGRLEDLEEGQLHLL